MEFSTDKLGTLQPGLTGPIRYTKLIEVYKKSDVASMREMLRLTSFTVPNKNEKPKPKSPEFVALMEKLRREQQEREYQQLVKSEETESFALAVRETRSHITTIFNIMLSVGSVVYAIWYWTATLWRIGSAYRVLLCLFFGLLILVAETVLYLGYLNKVDDARTRERKKMEKRNVVRTWGLEKATT